MSERKSVTREDVRRVVRESRVDEWSTPHEAADAIFDALPATPPASETVEAAWESLADDPNMPYGYGIADTIAAHRPHIEAAIRAESGDLDDHERVRIFNESYAKGRRDALDEARAAVERERGESRRQVRAAYDLALAAIDALREGADAS